MSVELQLRLNDKKRHFDELKASVPQKQQQIVDLSAELRLLEKQIRDKPVPATRASPDPSEPNLYTLAFQIKEKLINLRKEIDRIENREDEIEFWLDYGELTREQSRPPPPPPVTVFRPTIVRGRDDDGELSDSGEDAWEEMDSDEYEDSDTMQFDQPVAEAPRPVQKRSRRGLLVEHFIDTEATQTQEAHRQVLDFVSGKGLPSDIVSTLRQDQCQVIDAQGQVCGGDIVLQNGQTSCIKCGGANSQLSFAKTPADRERSSYTPVYSYKN